MAEPTRDLMAPLLESLAQARAATALDDDLLADIYLNLPDLGDPDNQEPDPS